MTQMPKKTTKPKKPKAPKKVLTLDEKLQNRITAIRQTSFWRYGTGSIEYDYERERDCDEYGCDCICRCSKIVNARITKVDLNGLVGEIAHGLDDEILHYCIDRIAVIDGMGDPDNYTIDVCSGYYGEEFDGIEYQSLGTLTEKMGMLIGKSDLDRVRTVLGFEYGYLIPALEKDLSISIIEVSPEAIKMGNEEYFKKLKADDLMYDPEYKLPRGVCMMHGDKAVICDGYHRITAAIRNGDTKIKIVALEKV
jgi:hypothetical protein